jgi:GYF domain 2
MWRIGGLRLYCGTVSSNSTASAVGAKVGATDGNDGTHTTGGIDYDRRNLIRLALQSGPDIVIIIKRRFNMRYWLTSGDGKTYGPYEVSELHKFATEGRTSAASQLCAEGSTSWVPFSSVIQQTTTAPPAPALAPQPATAKCTAVHPCQHCFSNPCDSLLLSSLWNRLDRLRHTGEFHGGSGKHCWSDGRSIEFKNMGNCWGGWGGSCIRYLFSHSYCE